MMRKSDERYAGIRTEMEWEKFLRRHDMLWTVRPLTWDEGAFLGNGMLGVMIYGEEHRRKRNVLRFVMGRVDVTASEPGSSSFTPRVPIGEFDLEMEGQIYYGTTMRLSLWNAELRAHIITTRGEAEIRCFVHSEKMVMIVEIQASEGERGCKLLWYPYSEVDPVLKNADGFNLNQYIPKAEVSACEQEGVAVGLQRYSALEGCTTAWKETVVSPDHRVYHISVANRQDAHAVKETVNAVKEASAVSLARLETSHRNWWHAYYRKSFVSLPDTRLEGFYWIQIYKLACATRARYKIIDNQGPWTAPTPWPGTWFNMNVQMSYSPVYTSNHLEIGESLCRNLDENMDNLIQNIPEEYRADSAGLGRSSSHDLSSRVDKEAGNLVWICHNYWRQYRHSMDDEMLRNRVYALLKRSVNYYLHILEAGEDGKLHLPPTISPEYGSFLQLTVRDCTYDLALLRWGCETLLKICERLHIHDSLCSRWRYVLEYLTDYAVDETGLMIGKGVAMTHGHRHFSHLLPVFPLHLISGEEVRSRQLILKSLRHWFSMEGDLRGFTFTGAASIAASIGLGNEALQHIKTALHLFKPNTMYREAGPVIESPLAAAESIHDMLLQSWGDMIRVFPAVPDEWGDVAFHDLLAEGAFLVSAVRRKGKTLFVRVKSLAGEPCRLKTDLGPKIRILGVGDAAMGQMGEDILALELQKGEEAVLCTAGNIPDLSVTPVASQESLHNFFGGNKPWRLERWGEGDASQLFTPPF